MQKGKGAFGAESSHDFRSKKFSKDVRRTSAVQPPDHSRLASSQSKNQLSNFKMKVDGRLLDYITKLEQNIGDTKVQIETERNAVLNLILNVSNFLGIKEVNEGSILKYIEEVSVQDAQQLESLSPSNNSDWFQMLQQHRFKGYLYGAGSQDKQPSTIDYSAAQAQQKRKPKKTLEQNEPKKKKKSDTKKSTTIHLSNPQPILISKIELQKQSSMIQTGTDYSKLLKNYTNENADVGVTGDFEKYMNNDLSMKNREQVKHTSKAE